MSAGLEELVDSLLYEGYALYPYTPGATKNATPTPFGIAYPPAYAALSGATFDHLQLECELDGAKEGSVEVSVRFLVPRGERHQAEEHEVHLDPVAASSLDTAVEKSFHCGIASGRVVLTSERIEDARLRLRIRVENSTRIEEDPQAMGRAGALGYSLISTLPVVRANEGRFISPLETSGCENVNTWPVLATEADDAVLGAAIVLPDHPVIAPQSKGNLFDGTEIEEALLLHIHALSDAEQEEIAGQDPRVREMIRRARATTARDLMDLHGIVRPVGGDVENVVEEIPGEEQVDFAGGTFRRGDRVRLRLGERAGLEDRKDAYDLMLEGKTATIERIYLDTDDRTYFGVTIDDDPGQDLMREMGRYLFFFIDEVETIA